MIAWGRRNHLGGRESLLSVRLGFILLQLEEQSVAVFDVRDETEAGRRNDV